MEHGLLRTATTPPRHVFEATGTSEAAFLRLARRFLGPEVPSVDLVHTGAIPVPPTSHGGPR